MNRERVEQCIQMMYEAQNLDMEQFQDTTPSANGPVDTIEELHTCGNRACFAGYLAISPEFRAAGGTRLSGGAPEFEGVEDSDAVARYLDISEILAVAIVYGCVYRHPKTHRCSAIYPGSLRDIGPRHVIAVLKRILSGELE